MRTATTRIYVVAEFPATAQLLERGGSAVWRVGGEDSDDAERGLLEEWGMDAVLAVSASDEQASGCSRSTPTARRRTSR